MKRFFLILSVGLVVVALLVLNSVDFAASVYKQEIFTLVNGERAKYDVSPVEESPILDKAARLKAQDMFAQNYWAHMAPDGTTPWEWFEEAGYQYAYAGENLAKDFDTPAEVVAGWMASPSHKENILDRNFSETGVAIVNGRLLGKDTTLVVQLFATPTSACSIPDCYWTDWVDINPAGIPQSAICNDGYYAKGMETNSTLPPGEGVIRIKCCPF